MIVVNDPGTWSAVYPPLLSRGVERLDVHRHDLPLLPLPRRRLDRAVLRAGAARKGPDGPLVAPSRRARRRRSSASGSRLNLTGVFRASTRSSCAFRACFSGSASASWSRASCFSRQRARAAAAATAALLLGYWALLASAPLDPENNLAARLDRAVFGVHTWKPGWDPEGLLSTLPAPSPRRFSARSPESGCEDRSRPPARAARPLPRGDAGAAAGIAWGRVLPINKSLWTPSYAPDDGGPGRREPRRLRASGGRARRTGHGPVPFLWLGRNAIAAFTLSTLGAIALIAIRVRLAGRAHAVAWTAIYRTVFDRFADPRLGSLLFALAYLALWTAVFGVLYRRRIFLKI